MDKGVFSQAIKSTNDRFKINDHLRLYCGPLSMFSAKVEIALREKQLSYDRELVPFSIGSGYAPKDPTVVAINPKAQIPMLIAGDLTLYDSTQIFEFLEDAFPENALWPTDVGDRARARQWEHWSDEILFPTALKLRDRGLSDEERRSAAGLAHRRLAELDAHLAGRAYVADSYGFADIALFMAELFSVLFGLRRRELPNIAAWRARLVERPAVRGIVEPMARYAEEIGVANAADLLAMDGGSNDG